MNSHTRPQYRWNGEKLHLSSSEIETQLNRLLRIARARNAVAHSRERPSLDEWPIAGNAFVWRPHLALDEKIGRPTQSKSPSAWKKRFTWLLLIALPVVACTLFAADVVSFMSEAVGFVDAVGSVDITKHILGRLGEESGPSF